MRDQQQKIYTFGNVGRKRKRKAIITRDQIQEETKKFLERGGKIRILTMDGAVFDISRNIDSTACFEEGAF